MLRALPFCATRKSIARLESGLRLLTCSIEYEYIDHRINNLKIPIRPNWLSDPRWRRTCKPFLPLCSSLLCSVCFPPKCALIFRSHCLANSAPLSLDWISSILVFELPFDFPNYSIINKILLVPSGFILSSAECCCFFLQYMALAFKWS